MPPVISIPRERRHENDTVPVCSVFRPQSIPWCAQSKTPGGCPPGVGSLPGSLRRSWIEVALPSEHRGPDVLVVEGEDGGPRADGWHDRGALEGGIAL